MQLIFDVASGLKGLGLLADRCGLYSAPRGRDFETKAIKHARSHHPKTKYSLARRRFYEAAFIRVRADKWVINISNSLARADIIFARDPASIWFGLTCIFLDLKKVSPNPRLGLGVSAKSNYSVFLLFPLICDAVIEPILSVKIWPKPADDLCYDPIYQQFSANRAKI